MEEWNDDKQRAKVAAGYKGGPFNKVPPIPVKTIEDGYPPEVGEKLMYSGPAQGNVNDPWINRRSK